jgi:hypothetical protein
MDNEGYFFWGVNWLGHTSLSVPNGAVVKNESCSCTPLYVFMALCLPFSGQSSWLHNRFCVLTCIHLQLKRKNYFEIITLHFVFLMHLLVCLVDKYDSM